MSVKLLTSGNGTPLMAYGEKFFASTTGAPETVKSSVQTEKVEDSVKVGNYECCAWTTSNDFPQKAATIIGQTGVLSTGLKFLHRVVMGQGVFPCKVAGYDAKAMSC